MGRGMVSFAAPCLCMPWVVPFVDSEPLNGLLWEAERQTKVHFGRVRFFKQIDPLIVADAGCSSGPLQSQRHRS